MGQRIGEDYKLQVLLSRVAVLIEKNGGNRPDRKKKLSRPPKQNGSSLQGDVMLMIVIIIHSIYFKITVAFKRNVILYYFSF